MSKRYGSKSCTLIDNGLFCELGIKLSADFGQVNYYSPCEGAFPKSSQRRVGDGIPGLTRCNEWADVVDETDLWVFPDVYWGGLQLHLESLGKRVWGSRKGEELEVERDASKRYFKKLGLPVGKWYEIIGLDNLRKHLKEHDNQWVKCNGTRGDFETFQSKNYKNIEPKLDELEHNLGAMKKILKFIVEDELDHRVEIGYDGYCVDGRYPDECVAGIEIKNLGYVGYVRKYADLPEEITGFNEKISDAMKGYRYRNFFSTEIRVGKDHVPYMVDACCYDEETEVLTDGGWKLFSDLDPQDKCCTLNPATKEIEYQAPSEYIKYFYNKEMVNITSPKRVLDLLVTPNHSNWVYQRDDRENLKEIKSDELTGKYSIPRTGIWKGQEVKTFTVPEHKSHWSSGRKYSVERDHLEESVEIDMDLFLKFMGIFLSEGHVDGYSVRIAQVKYNEIFREIIAALPFNWSEHKRGFVICSAQLATLLKDTGDRLERGIPGWIKNLSPRQIDLFLDFYVLGDGQVHKGQRIISTTSKRTADDLQELFLKAGLVADVAVIARKGKPVGISNGKYFCKNDSFAIRERSDFKEFYFEGWNNKRHGIYLKKVPYAGWVYDVEVPNHILYIRRKGKPCWSGNCRNGSPPNELYQNMIDNLAEIIWEGADGNLVQPKYNAKCGVEVMIHSEWADKNWQAVQFPEKYRDNIKFRNLTIIDGEYYVVPQSVGLPEIGSVVASGDTVEEASEKATEICEQVEGFYITKPTESIEAAQAEFDKLEEMGIKI
jgi:hypothetical protein